MKRYALIGKDIQDSLSPELHNDWMKQFGIDGDYELLDCIHLPDELILKKYDGFNITSPFKQFIPDKIINTVLVKGGEYICYNTDGMGFLKAAEIYGYDFHHQQILIIGRGATGKEIQRVLIEKGYIVSTVPGRTSPEILEIIIDDYDKIINATNQEGGYSNDAIDINYKRKGKDCFGYEMLKQQAALSFDIWHGFNPLTMASETPP